jgi:hypothetical protein
MSVDEREPGPAVAPRAGRLEGLLGRLAAWQSNYDPIPERIIHRRLHDEERIIDIDRRSLPLHVVARTIRLAGAVALGVAVYRLSDGYERSGLALWLTLILPEAFLGRAGLRILRDRYTSFVITNLRLMRVDRVLWPRLSYLPWSRVIGVSLRGVRIHIESASRRSGLREITNLASPRIFHLAMLATLRGDQPDRTRQPDQRTWSATRWRKLTAYLESRLLGRDPQTDEPR